MATLLMPLPACDFDPTEVAVSWRILVDAGHDVVFATPSGQPGEADDLMVTGRGLDFWGAARRSDYDALVLPGGHRARGMRDYLESLEVRQMAVDSFRAGKPVGAICHGVLVAARAVEPATGRSVLHGHRTTALTWQLERRAWELASRTRFWDPDYYRTYVEEPGQPAGYMSVQQEVTRALADPGDFVDVERGVPDYRRKTSGRSRDTPTDSRPAWVVRDDAYVSARWPGDAHTFARTFAEVLAEEASG